MGRGRRKQCSGCVPKKSPVSTGHIRDPAEIPLSENSLLYWLDVDYTINSGDGTIITSAEDRSGLGNTISPGAAGQEPIFRASVAGGYPAIDLNGRWFLTLGTSQPVVSHLNGQSAASREFTVITVQQDRTNLITLPWSWNKSTASTRHLTCRANSNTYKPQILGGTTSGAQPTLDAPTFWEHPVPKVFSTVRRGTSLEYWVDGIPIGSVPWTWVGNFDVDGFSVGAQNNPVPVVGGALWVQDVLVFDRALAASEIGEWSQYLRLRRKFLFYKASLGAPTSKGWLIIAMLGQSNVMGYCLASPDYGFSALDSYYMAIDGFAKPMVVKYADGANDASPSIAFATPVGPGPAAAMAQRLRELGETRNLLFVACGQISTDSASWKVGLTSSPPSVNDLIGYAKHRIRDALKAFGAKLLIVVDQGEANCDTMAEADAWDNDWGEIMDELVSYFGAASFYKSSARFVVGRLSLNISGVGAFAANVRASEDALEAARSDVVLPQRPDGNCEAVPGLHLTDLEQQSYGRVLAETFWSA